MNILLTFLTRSFRSKDMVLWNAVSGLVPLIYVKERKNVKDGNIASFGQKYSLL